MAQAGTEQGAARLNGAKTVETWRQLNENVLIVLDWAEMTYARVWNCLHGVRNKRPWLSSTGRMQAVLQLGTNAGIENANFVMGGNARMPPRSIESMKIGTLTELWPNVLRFIQHTTQVNQEELHSTFNAEAQHKNTTSYLGIRWCHVVAMPTYCHDRIETCD